MKSLTGFLLILIMAAGLRLFKLGSLPVILNRDEAALAYNAYLLERTGLDEWGRSWPLSLESFGDYKLPGYSMTLVVLFTLFNESEFIVRLPAAMAGFWLVVMGFVIAKKLKWSTQDQLLVALFCAVTPVFIFYSRMAWEATLSLAFMVTAFTLLYFTYKNRQRQILLDVVGVLLMAAAIFTYNIPFILLPFFLPLLVIKRGWRQSSQWWLPVVGLGIVLLGTAVVFIPLTGQKSGITIFSDPTIYANWIEFRNHLPPFQQEIMGSKYVYLSWLMAQRIVATFSPLFMVIRGGSHPWHQVPGSAHISWIVYCLGWLGLGQSIWNVARASYRRQMKSEFRSGMTWLYLIGISLLPAVITVDAPHATRSLLFFYIWLFLAVVGWQWLRQLFANRTQLLRLVQIGVILVLVGETVNYSHAYFKAYPSDQNAFKPGLSQALSTLSTRHPDQNVAVIDPDGYHYILVAWYLRLSPDRYFTSVVRQQPDRIGFRYGERVDRFHFIARPADRTDEEVVLEWQNDHWEIWQGE